jgi:hypothetical protein
MLPEAGFVRLTDGGSSCGWHRHEREEGKKEVVKEESVTKGGRRSSLDVGEPLEIETGDGQ